MINLFYIASPVVAFTALVAMHAHTSLFVGIGLASICIGSAVFFLASTVNKIPNWF
jgi:hypothetical protein